MKIIKQKKIESKFLNLKLVNNKLYINNNFKKNFNDFKLIIKTNLKLIFKFHTFNKKILFLGVSNKFNRFIYRLIKKTKHFYLPSSFWLNGILTNSTIILKYLILSKKYNILLKYISKLFKINLAVIFNFQVKNLKELFNLQIPVLNFKKSLNKLSHFINLQKNTNFSLFLYFLKILKSKINY